nr:MAG TPA: hypothetical protein [Caudoviricetes sp.]
MIAGFPIHLDNPPICKRLASHCRVFIVCSCTPADAPPFRKQCTRLYPCTHGECVTRTRDNMARIPRPPQCRKISYSGARTDALDPNEGARHQKEIRGINGAGEVSSRPSERRKEKSIIRFENRNAVLHSTFALDHAAACVLPTLGEINEIRICHKPDRLSQEPKWLCVVRCILKKGVDDFDRLTDIFSRFADSTLTRAFNLIVGLVLHRLRNK